MSTPITPYERMRAASEFVRTKMGALTPPRIGIVVGSGFSDLVEKLESAVSVRYPEIPHFHAAPRAGHQGRLVGGMLADVPVVMLDGRLHVYEGYSMEDVVFPVRVACALGIDTLVLTNASGAVNPGFRPGDLMLIEDHINLMGDNPLRGPHRSELGPRFSDMSVAYDRTCLQELHRAGRELDLPVKTGIYAAVPGPVYETPAEIRMLRTLGADAVGMSTVPECIAANQLGVRVAGVSSITNLASGQPGPRAARADGASKTLELLLEKALPELVRRG